MTVNVKICGVRTPEAVVAAVGGGARFVGFVFFRRSPRYVHPADAYQLGTQVPESVARVGLVVDASDEDLQEIVTKSQVDVLQLHGSETPERVAAVRARLGRPVIKAIAVGTPQDLDRARSYESVADWLLFDAVSPPNAARPGGNAVRIDWEMLHDYASQTPWILAGGLTADVLERAVASTGARNVDVSSGVESAPGVKSPALISAFLDEARSVGARVNEEACR